MTKIAKLRKKSKPELQKVLGETREKLRTLRFNLATGKLKNVREIRQLRKDIARILTIMKHETHNMKQDSNKS